MLFFFVYFSVSKKRNIKRSPNGMKPLGAIFLEQMKPRRLGVDVKKEMRRPRGSRALPRGVGAPRPSWAPRGSTDLLLPPIYIHVPREHPRARQKPNSTTTTFCIREIPPWSLPRHFARGGIDHGGPLHQHPCPSDEL